MTPISIGFTIRKCKTEGYCCFKKYVEKPGGAASIALLTQAERAEAEKFTEKNTLSFEGQENELHCMDIFDNIVCE